jgi:hypothetical protein
MYENNNGSDNTALAKFKRHQTTAALELGQGRVVGAIVVLVHVSEVGVVLWVASVHLQPQRWLKKPKTAISTLSVADPFQANTSQS